MPRMLASGRSTADAARDDARSCGPARSPTSHNRRAWLKAAFPRLFGFDARFGLRDDRLIMERLNAAFGDLRIEAMSTPLHLTATDFANGNQAVFSSGRAIDAIRASIAVPFLFSPWPIDGRLYIDGYMSDPLPVGVAMREGAEVIVAMGFDSPYQEHISTAGRFAFQVSAILSNNLLKSQFSFHGLAHHAEIIPIIPQFNQRIRHVRHRKDSLHHRGRRARGRSAVAVSVAAARRAGGGHGGQRRVNASAVERGSTPGYGNGHQGRQRSTSAAMSSVCGASRQCSRTRSTHRIEQLAAVQRGRAPTASRRAAPRRTAHP